ncbi:MAG: TolC family protein [Bacteroides sp.]|nr:TolC family protein [Bacteroides sp.]
MSYRFIPAVLLFFVVHTLHAQLSIEECYVKAEANYPLIRQYDLIERTRDYNLSNAFKGYLPQFQLSAKATYQSEVTQLPFDSEEFSTLMPGVTISNMSKDQYSATLDLNQNIWDGGTIKAQQENIRRQAEVDKNNLEVTLYPIRSRVNQLFFGILLQDEMLNQNTLYQEELQRNYTQVSAYMENGLANKADLDAVKVEQLQAVQSRINYIYTRKAYLEMFSALIGEKIDQDTPLLKPDADQLYPFMIRRPELSLYQAQINQAEASKKEINAGIMPKIGVFVTGGYSKPGLDMFKDKFSAYYIAGASLSWNISNFYTRKNNLRTVELNKAMIQTQMDTFLFNTNLDITQNNSEIQKYREIVESDTEIIRLRNSVKRSAEAKLANGTLSVLDLMKEVNAEQTAIQDKILHEIEFIQAVYNLKYSTNN